MVTFFYTNCPNNCPLTMHYVRRMQNILEKKGLLGEEIIFLSISLDPSVDT
ncbi:SCO family protein [Salirhabdus euzebyi]|uniref:SCO family protein n=1 Tax=Salirhabdus euzebyi TaxID=394506 RepID=UPI001C882E5F